MYITHYMDKNVIEQLTDIDMILQSWERFCDHFDYEPDEKEFPLISSERKHMRTIIHSV